MAAVSPLASPQDVAFAGLYERHAGRVFAYCLRWLRSREEAEEAAQTTFFHAWRSLGRGVEPEFETAWLLTIARNVCRNATSTRRREVAADPHVLEDTLEAPQAPPELDGLRQALASLTDQQRQALLLREWQGLSYSEIAAEMGLSQSAVETLLFRARRSLAARLRRPLSIGSLLPWIKSVLGGAAAVVAVTATSVAVMHEEGKHAKPAPARHHRLVVPAQQRSAPSVVTPMRVVHKRAATRRVVRGGAPPRTVVAPAAEAPSAPPPTATTTETATPPAAAASPAPSTPAAPVTQTVQDTVQGVVDTATQTAGDVVNTVTTAVTPVVDTVTSAVPTVPTVPTVTTPTLPTLP